MDKLDAKPDRTFLYRGIGLFFIALGAFLFGAGCFKADGLNNPFDSIPFYVVMGIAAGVATLGVMLNGLAGMIVFALGWAVFGCVIVDGAFPSMLYAMGIPCLMIGATLRMFNRP